MLPFRVFVRNIPENIRKRLGMPEETPLPKEVPPPEDSLEEMLPAQEVVEDSVGEEEYVKDLPPQGVMDESESEISEDESEARDEVADLIDAEEDLLPPVDSAGILDEQIVEGLEALDLDEDEDGDSMGGETIVDQEPPSEEDDKLEGARAATEEAMKADEERALTERHDTQDIKDILLGVDDSDADFSDSEAKEIIKTKKVEVPKDEASDQFLEAVEKEAMDSENEAEEVSELFTDSSADLSAEGPPSSELSLDDVSDSEIIADADMSAEDSFTRGLPEDEEVEGLDEPGTAEDLLKELEALEAEQEEVEGELPEMEEDLSEDDFARELVEEGEGVDQLLDRIEGEAEERAEEEDEPVSMKKIDEELAVSTDEKDALEMAEVIGEEDIEDEPTDIFEDPEVMSEEEALAEAHEAIASAAGQRLAEKAPYEEEDELREDAVSSMAQLEAEDEIEFVEPEDESPVAEERIKTSEIRIKGLEDSPEEEPAPVTEHEKLSSEEFVSTLGELLTERPVKLADIGSDEFLVILGNILSTEPESEASMTPEPGRIEDTDEYREYQREITELQKAGFSLAEAEELAKELGGAWKDF